MGQESQHFYEFGAYRLSPADRLLFRGGQPVSLPPKAVDTLLMLLERQGHVVHKDELMQRVWPNTFVEEANLTQNISLLRKALGDGSETGGHTFIETIPRRGYRFVAPVALRGEAPPAVVMVERTRSHLVFEETQLPVEPDRPTLALPVSPWRRPAIWLGIILPLIVGAWGLQWWFGSRPGLPFEKRDWVLILDFENTTGEAQFDRALLTAFTASLEQSHHANVYSHGRLAPVLKRMGKGPEVAITEDVATEIAQREGIRALVACGITRAGQQYTLTARLIDPQKRVAVAAFTQHASSADGILEALDDLAGATRRALGESLHAISQARRPLPQVTTASLDALKAYVDGVAAWRKGKYPEARALYERALELDPEFAVAHDALGSALYSHAFSLPDMGKEHYEKALQLADRVTDRERSLIRARYAGNQGHVEEALQLFTAHLTAYPGGSA